MKARHYWLAVVALGLLTAPAYAQQSAPVGRVKVVSGSAFVVRSGASIRAEVGQSVFESDSLRTGDDGGIGVTLNDDTRLSLGPSSEVSLDSFKYSPAELDAVARAAGLRVVRHWLDAGSAYSLNLLAPV